MESSQRRLRLLSFDGGGIRGLSSLYLLKSIMQRLEAKQGLDSGQHLLPCDIFDLIAGTSTGGLIAIMLGILRMDVQTCINEYINLAPKIFPLEGLVSKTPIARATKLLLGRHRFDPQPLEQEIQRLVNASLKDVIHSRGGTMRSDVAPDQCRVFVCANTEKYIKLSLFRNYASPWDDSENCEIWEACRATSAAPTFFPAVSIGKPPIKYVDGALGHNNPIRSVLNEAKHLWPSRELGCIISIGTGVPPSVDSGPTLKRLLTTLKSLSTDVERTAHQVLQEMEAKYGTDQNVYFRFNVQRGLESVRLDEWKKLDSVIVATRNYVDSEQRNIQRCISQIAKPDHQPEPTQTTPKIAEKESQLFRIPFTLRGMPAIGHFVPRPEELKDIERYLIQDRASGRRQVFVLHGLGGTGKTQIALEFARSQKANFTAIFWLQGDSLDSLKLSLAEVATCVRANFSSPQLVNKFEGDDRVETLSREALEWLSKEGNDRWLLIYDNCDTLSNEKHGYDLTSMFPVADHGSILVTTRRSQLSSLANSQRMLREMEEEQSIALLEVNIGQKLAKNGDNGWNRDSGLLLAQKLDGLPLALVQAARFIKMTGLDISTYIDLYETSWVDLVQHMPDVPGYLFGSIQRTWTISFNSIKQQNPRASNLLRLFSCFDCHDIWTDLIMDGNQATGTPQWFRDLTESRLEFLAAVGILLDFSLLRKRNSADSFSIHPVVHQWLATYQRDDLAELIRIAVVAIGTTAPNDREPRVWALQKRLMPHATRVYNSVAGPSQLTINWGFVGTQKPSTSDSAKELVGEDWTESQMEHPLQRLGWLYFTWPDLEKAKSVFQLGMTELQSIHEGEANEHPLLLRFANCLALVLIELEDFENAEFLANMALDGYIRIFGKESKWSIKASACLAELWYARGEHTKAVEIGEEVVSMLRPNPEALPHLLPSYLNNLSIFYSTNGQLEKSIAASEESLNLKFKRLSQDHPTILMGLENLAGRYMESGKYEDSERVLKQCIAGYERVYGRQSALAIAARDYLAHLYHKSGRLREAADLYRSVLLDYEALHGGSHPYIVRCASNLSIALFQQWEKDHPFVIKLSSDEPAGSLVSFPRKDIVELCRVTLKYPEQDYNFGYLARMLFRHGDVEYSRTILQGQATREAGGWSYASRACDAINSEHLIGAERFVCMVCEDVDVCRACMAKHQGEEIVGGSCDKGHPFLDVSIPAQMFSVNLLEKARNAMTDY